MRARGGPPRALGRLWGNGLARAAIRFKPASFAGTFVALCTAAMIISACGFLADTGAHASVPAHRYGDAPVVVTANQDAYLGKDTGSAERVPETARFDTAWARKAAAAPGVAAAVPDVRFTVRSGGPGERTLTGHGWGSTAFTGERLSAGGAPRAAGQAVLDAGTARAAHAGPGDRVVLTTPYGDRTFRVSGIAEVPAPTVWFTDTEAQALAGHPGRADALAVLPERGTGTDALASAVTKALAGTGARVHTGDARGGVEDPGVAYAQETLEALGFSFGGIAAMTAVFTAAGTVSLSIGQRGREFALLRAVGATPRQIRRSVATEAMLVAPLAAVLGCLPGMALADWWFGALRDRGAIPPEVTIRFSAVPVWVALGTVVGTALLAGYAAARRPAKIRPGQALSEAATERFRPGVIRTLLGLGALAGGVVLARLAAAEGGEDAANIALGVVLTLMLAVALLSQYVAKACAWVLGLPLRAGSASSSLAAANSWANARRLASAITPVALALAFCSTLIFLHTSEDRQVSVQQRDGLVADHVLTAEDGLPATAAEQAARTPGVAHAVGLLRTQVLVPAGSGGDRWLQSSDAQGVGGSGSELAAVQDLGVREGSLARLDKGTVAVDRLVAKSAGVTAGERLGLRLPDGTEHTARVVAVYQRGSGLSPVTLPRQTLEGHVDSAYDSEVLVRDRPDADPAAVSSALGRLGEVTGKDGWTKAQDTDRAVNAWGNRTMALVLGGFAAVAAGNTLVMTVLDRRRELRTLRLVGSTRRQVLRMVRWEALMVAAAGVALGASIAAATLFPMTQGLFESSPYAPPLLCAAFVGGVVALAVTFSVLPARAALRGTADAC
ncbi:ABC transporter permease [Streptomyces armeniacus]|uniref:ABC transporter permease n=1 Tax=Streptomyces armeniacus TaxID=83291 RepID=A0A345XR96_9ACTN|nr:ABC transporter permease [Streptomyces armeniacus]AXK34162.1 ABC transporter permease [Streptomyces armeniacus]